MAVDPDAQMMSDGAPGDGPAIDAPSDSAIDAGPPMVVARYLFDDDLGDESGTHDATAVGTDLTYLEGRNGATDHAVRIPTTLSSYVTIADAPAFDLAAGEIEVWFRFDGTVPDGDLGLVSRDAIGSTTNGHVSLRIGHDRRLVLRIQRTSTPTIEAYRCSILPVSANTWHRVVVAFGGSLTMQIDGFTVQGTSWADVDGVPHDCTATWTTGIDGNDNPWVVGALTVLSTEGTGLPVNAVAGGVQIDELVIRRVP